MKNTTVELWKNVHKHKLWHDNLYPTANTLAFYRYHISPIMKTNTDFKILDVGCGTGVNTGFFSENGCKTYGCDISTEALLKANIYARNNKLSIEFKKCSFDNLTYDKEKFDAIFCEGVLYYGSEMSFNNGVSEMYRVLKSNGVLRVYTKSDNDVWANIENKVSDHQYIIKEGYEKGMKVYCPSIDQIKDQFSIFKNVSIGVEEFNYVGLNHLKSFWVITATK